MDQPPFEARRLTRTHRQTIEAPPETVFPLLCPVREAEWLEGWGYHMIYSESGLVEEGAVFSTASEGEPDTVWIVTRHDRHAHEVEFARFTPGSRTCVLRLAVTARDAQSSYVDVTYTYTGLSPAGNDFLDHVTAQAFREGVIFWEASMNHFLRTGGKLTRAAWQATRGTP